MNSQQSTTVAADAEREPSMAVIELVADATGVDPIELDPLYNAIEPEAIDSLCASSRGFRSLSFEYAGHTVSIEQSGETLEISLESITIGTDRTLGVADGESSP